MISGCPVINDADVDCPVDCETCEHMIKHLAEKTQAGCEAVSAGFALLNAKDIAVAEKLTKDILHRLEGGKNHPIWLGDTLNTLRGVLWKAKKRSESI